MSPSSPLEAEAKRSAAAFGGLQPSGWDGNAVCFNSIDGALGLGHQMSWTPARGLRTAQDARDGNAEEAGMTDEQEPEIPDEDEPTAELDDETLEDVAGAGGNDNIIAF